MCVCVFVVPGLDHSLCVLVFAVPSEWLAWSSWGLCSVTCGGGVWSRTRECNMTTHAQFTGPCEGDSRAEESCHDYDCTPSELLRDRIGSYIDILRVLLHII